MKLLITGAGGMLGTDLCASLSRSFEIVGAGQSSASHLKIPYIQLDLRNAKKTEDVLRELRPDAVIHGAAMTHVDGCESNPREAESCNVNAVENVAAACEKTGAALVMISTDYVFDGKKKGEYAEEDKPNPISVYGRTKYEAEKFLLSHSAAAFVIIRLSWLYGLHGKSFPRTVLEKSETEKGLQIVSDQVGRPTYTRDVSEAFTQLFAKDPEWIRHCRGEIFHLANEDHCSWADFAEKLLAVAGKKTQIERITSGRLNRPAPRPSNSVLSLKKTQGRLGIRLRNWQEAAEEFVPLLMKDLMAAKG